MKEQELSTFAFNLHEPSGGLPLQFSQEAQRQGPIAVAERMGSLWVIPSLD
jgi:hypothetical protein